LNTSSVKRQTRVILLLVAGALVGSHLGMWLLPGVFASWNGQMFDHLFRLRQSVPHLRLPYDDTIVHVDLNNTTIQKLNNYYLSRSHFAQTVRNLAAMGVAAQAYDFIFASRLNPEDDQALIDATRAAGRVYYGLAFSLADDRGPATTSRSTDQTEVRSYLDRTRWPLPPNGALDGLLVGRKPLVTFIPLASVARGLGFLNLRPDPDGVFRRLPLLVKYDDGSYPSFALRIVCDYLGVAPENIIVTPGRHITLKNAARPGNAPHDILIPIDERGIMLVNFIGPWDRFSHYNLVDIYQASTTDDAMEDWADELKGRIVLVSDVSTGVTDLGPVPTDLNFPLSGFHANAIHTILTEQFLREASRWERLLVMLGLGVIVVLLSLRFATAYYPIHMVLLAAAYVAIVAASFLKAGLVLDLMGPLVMIVVAAILVTAYRFLVGAREKEVLRRTFEAYFPPLIVKKIMANPTFLTMGGQKKELTVLFSDIKDFTTHSAALTPAQVQQFLNEYFEAMVEIVFQHEGTVDKYIGDGLMVFFGDPEPQPDHALRCVRTAIAMQQRTAELREKWLKRGGFPLRIRIGINTGEVVVGNMGSARRLAYTVLGSAVNLASRLESNAPVGGILISERTHELVKADVPTQPVGPLTIKGLATPITAHTVQGPGLVS